LTKDGDSRPSESGPRVQEPDPDDVVILKHRP
jgi:hypothetical protein